MDKDEHIANLARLYRDAEAASSINLEVARIAMEKLKEAEKVIEFYGDKDNWQDCRIKNDFITGIDMILDREYFYIGGKIAREYQAKYKEDIWK